MPADPGARLDAIKQSIAEGGWDFRLSDAERMHDALAAALHLHDGEYIEDEERNRCMECGDDWPCLTVRELTGALGGDDENRELSLVEAPEWTI